MTNEIKEIINDLQRVADRKCYPEDILDGSIAQEWVDYIENYITNLQEENKHLLYQMEKAVDYIISTYHDEPTALYGLVRADELLDILRGDE